MGRFFLFFFCLIIGVNTGYARNTILVMKGDRVDYLYEMKSGVFWAGTKKITLEASASPVSGYCFAGNDALFCFSKGKLRSVTDSWQHAVSGCLLPVPAFVESLQVMVHGGVLYLPVFDGFKLLTPGKGKVSFLPWRWHLTFDSVGGAELEFPEMVLSGGQLWALGDNRLLRFSGGRWKTVMTIPEKDLIEAKLYGGKLFVNLLLFKVTRGDLGSFRTRVISFTAGNGNRLMDREFDGVLKNPGTDCSGRLVFEYVKTSIWSALVGRKNVRLRMVDPGTGKVFTRSFSVGDKRRHLFYVDSQRNMLLLVVQCKNGNVFAIEPFSGKFGRLGGRKFNYDFSFMRGMGCGVFYNESTGDCIPVSVDIFADRRR